ncbi:uncharacterized protein LOC115584383 isoform X6 [Sparus aurata]|nr:uncharacterized protein LOC115584383 isoform X6 [Sparus aurata]
MDGNATLTCEADGKWSSPPPKCTLSGRKVAAVVGGVVLAAAGVVVGGAVLHNMNKDQRRQKRLVEEIAPEAEEEVALLDGVGLKQSPTGNGQTSGEGHRGQVPRKRVNPFGRK